MKLNTGAAVPSKIVIELFDDICPKTCANFRKLCEGFKPENGSETLSYAGTEFHRVVKGMYIQAGNLGKVYGKLLFIQLTFFICRHKPWWRLLNICR